MQRTWSTHRSHPLRNLKTTKCDHNIRSSLSSLSHPLLRTRSKPTPPSSSINSPSINNTSSEDIQKESLWTQLKEDLFGISTDCGNWNLSPEWYGTQGGGWGRDDGRVVFSKQSQYNGLVEVTAHEASPISTELSSSRQEWRVLRFNKTTRQSVARVSIPTNQRNRVIVHPECLAQEYLKSIASVIAALIHIHSLDSADNNNNNINRSNTNDEAKQQKYGMRILCIGVGGGSLPLFLSHHFPSACIDAVEIDPTVVEAATTHMGLLSTAINNNKDNDNGNIGQLNVYTEDAVDYLQQIVSANNNNSSNNTIDNDTINKSREYQSLYYDIIVIDAFDGVDDIPNAMFDARFVELLQHALHPQHGSIVMNIHSIDEVQKPCSLYHTALSIDNNVGVQSFCVSASKQQNVVLVCSRGDGVMITKERMREAAVDVAGRYGYVFAAGSRASREFKLLLK